MRRALNIAFNIAMLLSSGATTSSLAQVRQQSLPGDAIQLVSVNTESGEAIERGHPIPLVVTLSYTLSSHAESILSLSTAQFQNSKCTGPGELIDAERRLVKRGSGKLMIHITWSGDTGENSKGRVYGQGSISFMGMLWESVEGHRGHRFGMFDLNGQTCQTF